jgi:HK97 gp10 family phage protein
MGVKLKGNKALLNKLKEVGQVGKDLIEEEVFSSLHEIRNEAVSRVPVDTGILKNSIVVQNEKLSGKVIVNAKYAPYVEFGTGTRVDIPEGLKDYAIKFKGKGIKEVNLPAQPFLFPAWFRETKELMINLEKGLSKIVKK